jgi:hypothetical protein
VNDRDISLFSRAHDPEVRRINTDRLVVTLA